MIGSNIDQSAFKVQSPKSRKAISVYAHHDDLGRFAQLAISVPDRRKRSYAWSVNQRVQIRHEF
jgi:hypothetical protein